MFPNFWSHSLFARFRGFAQLRGSLCIAIPMQACTQWTHSDVWSQLATTPGCLVKVGERQSEKKRRNGDRRAICNSTRGIDVGRGVIRHRGVSDGSDGARPLWRSQSAQTEMFFADVTIAKTDFMATGIGKHALINQSYGYVLKPFWCTWTSINCKQKLQLCHEYASCISFSIHSTQYHLVCLCAKWNWQMSHAAAVITRLKTYAVDSLAHLNVDHVAWRAAGLLWICELGSLSQTQQLNIALPDFLAKLDCQIFRSWYGAMRLTTDWRFPTAPGNGSIMFLSFFWILNVYGASGFRYTTNSQLTNNLKPFAASNSTLILCH
jgi:hypothetical protein